MIDPPLLSQMKILHPAFSKRRFFGKGSSQPIEGFIVWASSVSWATVSLLENQRSSGPLMQDSASLHKPYKMEW